MPGALSLISQNLCFASRLAAVVCMLIAISACATQMFVPSTIESHGFEQRALSQTEDFVKVTAAVPSPEEVIELFGIDLYADGIQPVWLNVENTGDKHVRVTMFSIDEDYYSPLEVAWLYRKRFTKSSRRSLERWLLDNTLPRFIPAGGSRSGFVFTHTSVGTKGFNVDVYTDLTAMNFTFFVPLPGFQPDYMNVDFKNLYQDDEIIRGDLDTLRRMLSDMPCCTTDESSEAFGDPLNIVIVGTPEAVRRSLLRGQWQETEANSPVTRIARTHFYRGRQPDGTFHKARPDGRERKELRLWRAPILVDGEAVWLGHVSYDMSGALFSLDMANYQIDPDVDDARMFVLQNFWYNQSLRGFAMADGIPPAAIEAPHTNFHGSDYFTDGMRAVLLVSEEPVAMDETEILVWETYVSK
ncbi:MAG TPA: LssY C-terminal domain-containing protein [Gammaproteobacteria bacterium]